MRETKVRERQRKGTPARRTDGKRMEEVKEGSGKDGEWVAVCYS